MVDWKPDFFTILLNPFATQLPLPHAFVSKHLKNKIPKNLTLESATGGHLWNVKIEKIGGSYCFAHGWNNVVRDAHFGYKDLLVFKLVRQSTFRVSVFSPNGCERYLPTSVIKIEDDDDEDEDEEDDDDDDDDDDEEDPFFITTISKTHKCVLRLPSKFVELAGIGGDEEVVTVKNVDGQEWELGLRLEESVRTKRYYFSPGWNEFRRSNELLEGDECLFKYIKNEGKLCLAKVSRKKSVAKTPTTEVVKRKRGRPPKKSPVTEEVKRKRGRPPAKIPVKRKRGRPFKDHGGIPSGTR